MTVCFIFIPANDHSINFQEALLSEEHGVGFLWNSLFIDLDIGMDESV